MVPDFDSLLIDLVQETPTSGYNYVQRYTFRNQGNSPMPFKVVWFNDQDVEFAETASDNRVGFVPGEKPRVYFIEESDVVGAGHPGINDRDRRISVIADPGNGITFDGFLGAAGVAGGATRLQNYLRNNLGILDEDLNTIQEIDNGTGAPTGVSQDIDGDLLMDIPIDAGAAMQFSLLIPARGMTTLGFDYVGGKLSNAVFPVTIPGDFDGNGTLDALDIDELSAQIRRGAMDAQYDLDGSGSVDAADRQTWVTQLKRTYFGDANLSGEFTSADLVAVFQLGQYEDTIPGNSTWASGDWTGDGDFTSSDFVLAFQDGGYENGPRPGLQIVPEPTCLADWCAISLGWYAWRRRRSHRQAQRGVSFQLANDNPTCTHGARM
jgi:hypothetical protein